MPPDPQETARSQGFRHLGEETRHEGWRITLVQATFEAPDGSTFTRDVVRHPGAVAVVAVTETRTALLVRQYRGPIDRELLEIPAGTRDVDGELPEETARRELAEEVGVRAGKMRLLGTLFNSPGFCDEETWLFLATELQPDRGRGGERGSAGGTDEHGSAGGTEEHGSAGGTEEHGGPEERFMEVVEVPLSEADHLITSGRLNDAQTVIGLLLARDVLGSP